MRWEMRLHNYGTDWPIPYNYLVNLGRLRLTRGQFTNWAMATLIFGPSNCGSGCGGDTIYNNGPFVTGCCNTMSDVVVRVQRDVANNRYTLEICNSTGGGCLSGTEPITAYGSPSWAGYTIGVSTGGQVAFLRWFSSVVPIGTPIPVSGANGDLGDWEFEGNLLDSSGHGLTLSGGAVTYAATPLYPPACNAGTQQSFRAGYPATLNGSGSYPLDGGTFLSYVWQVNSGPSTLSWSSHTAADPAIRGLVFGSYVFQLTVTDSSNQSSVCAVKDGAVATDDNNIVITNNTAVDTLLGPMVRYGANAWPWFDNRHKQAADNQISVMDSYFPAWWDTPSPGTVSVTSGSTAVVGAGTTFTTTFCQGPANPTVPQTGYPMIAIWHPMGSGTGRVEQMVTGCADDTHLTLMYPYNSDGKTPPGSNLTYAADNTYAIIWGWGQTQDTANYYDNVAAYYALYYRSGIDDYLTAARKLADRFWESPGIDQGAHPNLFAYISRSTSALGLVLRALDGRPDMWTAPPGAPYGGLHTIWNDYMGYLNGGDVQWGLWDVREEAYHLSMTSYCALFDIDPTYQSTCKTTIINSFPGVWTPAMAPGSWLQLYPGADTATNNNLDSWDTTPTTSVTLTNGQTTVTGVGTTWTSGDFPAGTRIWFTNSASKRPPNNAAGDPISYVVASWNSPTQLTLSAPYQGTTGTHGWEVSGGNVLGWAQQPYMMGILSGAFDLAAKAVAEVSPSTAALAHSYNVAAANWIKNIGYWPDAKGLLYTAGSIDCMPPNSNNNTICTAGTAADQARALSPEAMRGLSGAYIYNHDPSLLTFADTLYNAMWAAPGTCPTGSTLCVPDGTYLDPMNDGQYMIAVPPFSSLGAAMPWKWLGMFFGYSAESSWPGNRLGGAQPAAGELMYVGANMASVPGAAAVRVVTTEPSGLRSTTTCTSLPCAVAVDRRQGDPLVSIQYLSVGGITLASSAAPLIGGQ
jgi:hypothetical protein